MRTLIAKSILFGTITDLFGSKRASLIRTVRRVRTLQCEKYCQVIHSVEEVSTKIKTVQAGRFGYSGEQLAASGA